MNLSGPISALVKAATFAPRTSGLRDGAMAEHQKGAPPPGTVVFGGPLDEGPERLRPPEDMNENELKMSKKHRYALMRAAGLPPGPYVSITAAVDIFRKRKLREAVVYLIFLLVFNVGAFVQRDVTDSHQYSQSVRAVITSREFPVYDTRPDQPPGQCADTHG